MERVNHAVRKAPRETSEKVDGSGNLAANSVVTGGIPLMLKSTV